MAPAPYLESEVINDKTLNLQWNLSVWDRKQYDWEQDNSKQTKKKHTVHIKIWKLADYIVLKHKQK